MTTSPWHLYVKTRCPWCVEAVEYLTEHGYRFEQIDVLRDPVAYERMKQLSGQRLTPTLVIEDSDLMLADFDTRQLESFLKKHDLKAG